MTLTDPSAQERTIYLDESGAFIFDHLKIGRYQLKIEEATLPFGYQVEGSTSREIHLGSGEDLELSLELIKKPAR